jgi:hypothetical protein
MLCAASGTLYSLENGVATSRGTIGLDSPLSYAEVEDIVYISSIYWNGAYDHSTKTLSSWGVTQPPSPTLLSASGSLPAGTYHVCMTNVANGELSGNGPISSITLADVGGISILNRPSGAIVWCTDQNEGIFYRVGETALIADIPTVEPLPCFMCSPPPYMINLCYTLGVMWGSVGNEVFYSQPFRPSWFRSTLNRFTFDSEVTMIARVPTGLFIGCKERTYFLHGTEPGKMQQLGAGAGSIRGTLAYCNNLPELGDILGTSEKGYVDVPVWRTTDGLVAGNASGRLFNLTKDKLRMDAPERGASLYTNVDGSFKFITSSKMGLSGSAIGALSADTVTLFEDGKVSQSEFTHKGQGTSGSFADTATAEVRRGGVLI